MFFFFFYYFALTLCQTVAVDSSLNASHSISVCFTNCSQGLTTHTKTAQFGNNVYIFFI